MQTLLQDLRYGARMLRKHPGFTFIAVITLALGIGANTAIFSLLDAVMLRTLPVAHPEQLVLFSRNNPVGGGESFSYVQFEQFRDHTQAFASVFGFAYRQLKVSAGGRDEEALVQLASGQYFSALGIRAVLGQTLMPANDDAVAPVAVISDGFWQRSFARDPAVVGKSLTINGNSVSIIGVAPRGFSGVSLDYTVDVWVPFTMQPQLDGQTDLTSTGRNVARVMARLKQGVSLPQATAEAELVFQQSLLAANASPEALAQHINLTAGGKPVSAMRSALTSPLLMLMVIVALVLLIACANLANLLLARAAARQREIAMRLALGASRVRLIQQLLTESVLLALIGGAVGVFVGYWVSDLLLALAFDGAAVDVASAQLAFSIDWRILCFTFALSMLAGVLFGLAPALGATRPDLIAQLKETTSGLSVSAKRSKLNQALVGAQLAVSLVLLIAAGLFVRSFQNLTNVELGFSLNAVQLEVTAPANYTNAQRASLWQQLREKLAAWPGVTATGTSLPGLFGHYNFYTDATVEGQPRREARAERDHDVAVAVAPGFFSTLEIPLLAGRDFNSQDHQHSAPVTIINETLAHRLFPSGNPLGQRLRLGDEPLEVVGVVRDAKYDSVLAAAPAMLYISLEQFAPALAAKERFFTIRAGSDAASLAPRLQQAAQDVDPNLLVESLPLANLVNRSLAVQRLIARLAGCFGLLGLLLVSVGVYGVMSHAVSQRTSEIGIRLALGAQRGDIFSLVLRQAMLPVFSGVAVGLAGSFVVMRVVGSQLFGLTATDPLTVTLATSLVTIVAAIAAWLPARRASLVDPLVTLRNE